jgi:hypothetical protein
MSLWYRGLSQIIPEEFEDDVPSLEKWKRFGCVLLGLALIHGVNIISNKIEQK